MANDYCTITQLKYLYDERVVNELSNDADSTSPDLTNVQFALDVAASELESVLTGRYGLPLTTVPLILTRWVAATAMTRLYARRSDKPKELDADGEWAKQWIKDLNNRVVQIPGLAPSAGPELYSSNFKDGRSQFDNIDLPFFDYPPTPTSTSHPNGSGT